MPPILALLLRLIAGVGGGAAATKFGPQLLKRVRPSLFAQGATKVGPTTLGGIGRTAAGFGGFVGGDVAAGLAIDQGVSGPPAASELGTEDIFRSLQSGQGFNSEQGRNVQRLFEETEIINVLASLGIDPNDFLSAAQPIV